MDAAKAHKRYLETLNSPHDGTVEFFYKKAKQLYVELSQQVSNEMSTDFLKYDNFSIVIGVMLSTLVSISFGTVILLEFKRFMRKEKLST